EPQHPRDPLPRSGDDRECEVASNDCCEPLTELDAWQRPAKPSTPVRFRPLLQDILLGLLAHSPSAVAACASASPWLPRRTNVSGNKMWVSQRTHWDTRDRPRSDPTRT